MARGVDGRCDYCGAKAKRVVTRVVRVLDNGSDVKTPAKEMLCSACITEQNALEEEASAYAEAYAEAFAAVPYVS